MHFGFIYQENPLQPVRGTGFYLRELVRGLLSRGHEVTAIQPWAGPVADVPPDRYADSSEDPGDLQGLQRHVFDRNPPRWMRWRPGLLWHRWVFREFLHQLHRQNPFDVLECMDGYGWMPFGGIRNVPLVVRLHGADFFFHHEEKRREDGFAYWLEKQTVRRADAYAGVSRHVIDVTLRLCGLEHRRPDATVIYNAIDTDHFRPGDPAETEPGRILFLNSLETRKGFDSLCRAFPAVQEKVPEARLILAGGITGKTAEKTLQQALAQLPPAARERVEPIGWVFGEKKLKELRKAAVCCYPSRSETFGISPAEAMATGKPVIYTKYGPGPELIIDGESGFLCDPDQPETITQKLLAVLENPGLAQSLGQKARERACQLFNHDEWIGLNLDFFTQLGSARPRLQRAVSSIQGL